MERKEIICRVCNVDENRSFWRENRLCRHNTRKGLVARASKPNQKMYPTGATVILKQILGNKYYEINIMK